MKNNNIKIIYDIFKIIWYVTIICVIGIFVSLIGSMVNYGNTTNNIMAIFFILSSLLFLLSIYELKSIISTVVEGRPFIESNITSFKKISLYNIIIAIFILIYQLLTTEIKNIHFLYLNQDKISINISILIFILISLFSLILAEIINYGTKQI